MEHVNIGQHLTFPSSRMLPFRGQEFSWVAQAPAWHVQVGKFDPQYHKKMHPLSKQCCLWVVRLVVTTTDREAEASQHIKES